MRLELRLPFGVRLEIPGVCWRSDVIFRAIEEHDEARVLLNLARPSEVCQRRPPVAALPLLDIAGELTERDDRQVERLRHLGEPAADVADFRDLVAFAVLIGPGDGEVVDEDRPGLGPATLPFANAAA